MTTVPPLNLDAIAWSVSESEREEALATRPLLVLMHGRGSHELDLFGLVPLLPTEVVIASVRAPHERDGGYAWFPFGEPGLPTMESADDVVAHVLAWLDTLPTAGKVGVMGFSQGGVMTTHLMRHAPTRFAAHVNLSGFTVSGDLPQDPALTTLRPPMFWGRDVADPMIPEFAIQRTLEFLPSHTTLELHEYPGIAHSISGEEIADVNLFLARTLLAP